MSISIQGQTGWLSIPNGLGRSRLPYSTLALLINLLTHSAGFNASYSTIKEQTGMAPTTIAKALDNLEKLGLITVKKVDGDGGKFASNHYIFHADNLWKIDADFVAERLKKDSPSPKNGAVETETTAPENGVVTAPENGVAPLQKMDTKNDQGEITKNDQPPVVPQGGQPPKKSNSRGERLPEKWMPDQRVIDAMKQENPHVDLEREHSKFTDHWNASSGANSRKRDWNAAWRLWIRRAAEQTPARSHNGRSSGFGNDPRHWLGQQPQPTQDFSTGHTVIDDESLF
ncbi:putative transcriptional regulator [Corynebacterium phage phi16]|uniref:helix-turn-helix domain-containing protein n=1 Tax=Corynebacterium glutamicum TaxID=1718 RepID=UPI000944FEA0|nr:helix-turn-helix domain-containing protein [Corynebacterium glutamicum]APQ42559.1 putative transcriptional regulator [Corynebacterium phage phi16]